MGTSKRYPVEVRERAVRLVFEHRAEYQTEWAAIRSIAEKFGVGHETLRKWVRRAEIDDGRRPGVLSELLGPELAFWGGTCLHKLHLPAPLRYSEDLDYVRSTYSGIKPYLTGRFGAPLGRPAHRRRTVDTAHTVRAWRGKAWLQLPGIGCGCPVAGLRRRECGGRIFDAC